MEFVKQLLLQDGIKDLGVSKQSETEGAFSSKAMKNVLDASVVGTMVTSERIVQKSRI